MTMAAERQPAPVPKQKEPADRISLVVSDVDGTLVTPKKELTAASIAAARALREVGIAFTIASSRPPRGLAMLTGPLGLRGAFAAYNGSALLRPDLSVIEQHLVPAEAARLAVDALGRHDVGIWLFSGQQWLLTDLDGDYVELERHTVLFEPAVVSNFDDWLGRAAKIVGASHDFDALTRCESDLRRTLDGTAAVHRSQLYYVDVTHSDADKGYAVRRLAVSFGMPLAQVAVIGDMTNDLPMFAEAGLAIAMGNASSEVKARAHFVTGSNEEDGFATAIDQFVLPRATHAGRPQ
jgi:Cof subfamily protein (haloacid dehalogenase superfamily)